MTISRPKATNCFAALRKETRRGVFRYTRERLGYMLRGTEALRVLTQRICAERIGFYTELAEAAERKKGLSRETTFAGR